MKNRKDFEAIIAQVPNGAKILDIGCGDGELIYHLQKQKNAIVRGLEISQTGVNASVARGLAVIQGDADKDLALFPDDAFDLVIVSNTIQATLEPKSVLEEIRRIGKLAIVSIPNFGYWRIRIDVLLTGRMPVTKDLPDTWYNTKNLHLCTLVDFFDLVKITGFKVKSIIPFINNEARAPIEKIGFSTNLFAEKAVIVLERN